MKQLRVPFEDLIYINIYETILFRSFLPKKKFTTSRGVELDIKVSKFIQYAIQNSYEIYVSNKKEAQFIKEIMQNYSSESSSYYFYVMYRELYRRKHRSADDFLSIVRSSNYPENFKLFFKSFDHKLSWDYLLMFLAHEELTKGLFLFLWHRYSKSLFCCDFNKYKVFIKRQYLLNINHDLTKSEILATDYYNFILSRAEKSYSSLKIFNNNK